MDARGTVRRLAVATAAVAAEAAARVTRRGRGAPSTLVMVFSRDRPLQLELLLDTFAGAVEDPVELVVMYSATDESIAAHYDAVFAQTRAVGVEAVRESDFAADLRERLGASDRRNVMFLVDDMAFVRPVPAGLIESWDAVRDGVLSLRLGRHITHSFNAGDVPQRMPDLTETRSRSGVGLVTWHWSGATGDWSLPTSLDGHVLPRATVAALARRTDFRAPNSLERALGHYRFLFRHRRGFALPEAAAVNFPLNSVKVEDFSFPHLEVDAGELSRAFADGKRLSTAAFPLDEHRSVHMPWVPELVDR